MIRRLRTVNNVGKFVKFIDSPNLEFDHLNIIYAENGRGKTTLTHIFRSLCTGDVNHITERVTAGVTDDSTITINLDAGTANFRNKCWDIRHPYFEIFDTTFINENVCSGYYVDIDHKRQLYRFVIGVEGVQLSSEIDKLDEDIRKINSEKSFWESEIKSFVGSQMSGDEFVGLTQLEDVDEQIVNTDAEIAALKDCKQIAERAVLQKVSLPTFPVEALNNLLQKQLADISERAEKRIREHIERCMGTEGEYWLRTGLSYIKDDLCPFCGQPIGLNDLVQTYKAYFSDAYDSLKQEIADFLKSIETIYSEIESRAVSDAIHDNETLAEFWSKYVLIEYPSVDVVRVQSAWDRVSNAARECLKRKVAAPLEIVPVSPELREAISTFDSIIAELDAYNQVVDSVNEKINEIKSDTATGDPSTVEQELEYLKLIKRRFEPDGIQLRDEHEKLGQVKHELEIKKKETRKKLDEYTREVLREYETQLNEHLGEFLAGFRIQKDKKPRYSGGKASTNYSIVINDVAIELGDPKTVGEPSFKSLLSEGDKNTLAFAFFMARLDMMGESGLKDKIIVFDDPVSSLDSHRKQRTQEQIERISRIAKQVIVSSHDVFFLKMIWDNTKVDNLKCFQIVRDGVDNSKLVAWDIERETQSDYFKNFHTLLEYLVAGVSGGDDQLRNVACCIRPLLEAHFKMRFPEDLKSEGALGKKLLESIDKARPGEPLHYVKPLLPELTQINDFAKQYHHDENPGADSELISDHVLRDFVKRTIEIIYGKT